MTKKRSTVVPRELTATRRKRRRNATLLEIMARQEFWRADSDLRAADTSLGPETCGFESNLRHCPP